MTVVTERITPDPRFDLIQPPSGELRPVGVRDGKGNKHTIETYYVPAQANPETKVFVFQPWSECVGVRRRFNQRRIDLIANITGGHVLGIDNPGIGNRTSRLTTDMFRTLASGSFHEVTQMIWDAVENHPNFDIGADNDLMFIGHSLGSSMATETAAHAPDGIEVGELVLLDSAVTRKRSFGNLALTLWLHGRTDLGLYQEETKKLNWEDMGSRSPLRSVADIVMQPGGHIGYGIALSKTTLADSIRAAYQSGTLTPETALWLINGGKSRVSPTIDNDTLARELVEEGIYPFRGEAENATHELVDHFSLLAGILACVLSMKQQQKAFAQHVPPQIRT